MSLDPDPGGMIRLVHADAGEHGRHCLVGQCRGRGVVAVDGRAQQPGQSAVRRGNGGDGDEGVAVSGAVQRAVGAEPRVEDARRLECGFQAGAVGAVHVLGEVHRAPERRPGSVHPGLHVVGVGRQGSLVAARFEPRDVGSDPGELFLRGLALPLETALLPVQLGHSPLISLVGRRGRRVGALEGLGPQFQLTEQRFRLGSACCRVGVEPRAVLLDQCRAGIDDQGFRGGGPFLAGDAVHGRAGGLAPGGPGALVRLIGLVE